MLITFTLLTAHVSEFLFGLQNSG